MFGIAHDEIPFGMNAEKTIRKILLDAHQQGAISGDDDIGGLYITKQYRLFGLPISSVMVLIDYDSDDY